MKENISYSEKLKHPLWQKKRLEILERDEFKCNTCGDESSELHVHHGYYENYEKPWECDNYYLHTLCDKCHKERHEIEKSIKTNIGTFENNDCLRELDRLIANMYKDNPNPINMLNKILDEINLESERIQVIWRIMTFLKDNK